MITKEIAKRVTDKLQETGNLHLTLTVFKDLGLSYQQITDFILQIDTLIEYEMEINKKNVEKALVVVSQSFYPDELDEDRMIENVIQTMGE